MSMLYWQIGQRINKEILQEKRAEYGRGWSEKQLRHCTQFAMIFPNKEILSTLWRQLSWSHIKQIIYIKDPLKRKFYIEICKIEKWSVRTFHNRINSMLYERTAISKKPDETIQNEIELLQLNNSNIKVAEYLTKLPDIKLLKQKLHQSIERAKNKLIQRETENE